LPAAALAKADLARLSLGGSFLLRYHALADIFPFGSAALFVVRTFLPFPAYTYA